jgi:uncharacterized membrane protein
MSYEEVVGDVVQIVEGVGVAIMVVGGIFAFIAFARELINHVQGSYQLLRERIGRVILLGLEVLIIADIIRTVVVDQSIQSVGVLGLIVLIRVVLSFSLEVEIDGVWPWSRWRVQTEKTTPSTDTDAVG